MPTFRQDQPVRSEDIFRPFYDLTPLTQGTLQKGGFTNFTDAANKKFLGRSCVDRQVDAGCGQLVAVVL